MIETNLEGKGTGKMNEAHRSEEHWFSIIHFQIVIVTFIRHKERVGGNFRRIQSPCHSVVCYLSRVVLIREGQKCGECQRVTIGGQDR